MVRERETGERRLGRAAPAARRVRRGVALDDAEERRAADDERAMHCSHTSSQMPTAYARKPARRLWSKRRAIRAQKRSVVPKAWTDTQPLSPR